MDKTLVYLKDGTLHSAWWSLWEAVRQVRVLQDNGYRDSYFEQIDHDYDNGQYFV